MNNYNISFSDIINKSYFKNDQQENVLKAISILIPNFNHSFINIDTTYNCNFLNQIPMSNNYESPAKNLLTNKELKELLKIQLENELAIEVQIPSIKVNEKNINIDIVRCYCIILYYLIFQIYLFIIINLIMIFIFKI